MWTLGPSRAVAWGNNNRELAPRIELQLQPAVKTAAALKLRRNHRGSYSVPSKMMICTHDSANLSSLAARSVVRSNDNVECGIMEIWNRNFVLISWGLQKHSPD